MIGPSIADRDKYASAQIGFHVAFMVALEAMGEDPLMILANEVPSDTAVEEHNWIGDLPGFEEWVDDRKLATLGAHKITIRNKDWANGVVVHRNEINDDKLGLVMPRINGLAQKASRHRGDLMVKSLLNGFDGTAYSTISDGLAFDGSFFFATDHSSEGGPAQTNKLTAALSESALESAEQTLNELTTYDGKDPLDMTGTHLIVGPKLRPVAEKLLRSSILVNSAGTAAGTNIIQGRYNLVVSPRIRGDYDDYWFLGDLSKPVKPFIFQNREPITTIAQVDWECEDMFKRGQMNFGAQARYNIGAFAWQTMVGSTGAG